MLARHAAELWHYPAEEGRVAVQPHCCMAAVRLRLRRSGRVWRCSALMACLLPLSTSLWSPAMFMQALLSATWHANEQLVGGVHACSFPGHALEESRVTLARWPQTPLLFAGCPPPHASAACAAVHPPALRRMRCPLCSPPLCACCPAALRCQVLQHELWSKHPLSASTEHPACAHIWYIARWCLHGSMALLCSRHLRLHDRSSSAHSLL